MAHNTNLDASLAKVCWGYRDIFKRTINRFYDEGYLGEHRPEVTSLFFSCISCTDSALFDHVLKGFLEAFGRPISWMLDLPDIFGRVVRTGCELADRKLYFGIRYFRLLGENGFGKNPESVRKFLGWIDSLTEIDEDLAAAFLNGYQYLASRLDGNELDRYIKMGIDAYSRSPKAGLRYLDASFAGRETIIGRISSEARLDDETNDLARLLRALSGREVPVHPISALDSDELLLYGSTIVACAEGVYLPDRVTVYDQKGRNKAWYLIAAVLAGAGYLYGSFPVAHGTTGFESVDSYVSGVGRRNLFIFLEYSRVLANLRAEWPGAEALLDQTIYDELGNGSGTPDGSQTEANRLLCTVLSAPDGVLDLFRPNGCLAKTKVSELCVTGKTFVDTYACLDELYPELRPEVLAIIENETIYAPALLADFAFPCEISCATGNQQVVAGESDNRDSTEPGAEDADEHEQQVGESGTFNANIGNDDEPGDGLSGVAYAYDEWCDRDGDYYRDYCFVREVVCEPTGRFTPYQVRSDEISRVRRVFEMLRPDTVHVEKRLDDGEEIDHELLVEYLVDRTVNPAPKIRFYRKPLVKQRDLSVLILLDSSGSTAESLGARITAAPVHGEIEKGGATTVLDVEKQAALLLGEGLAILGDRFSLCGFSGSGRMDCRFYLYKRFSEGWNSTAAERIGAAQAHQATRIGAALRHAGYLMGRETTRRKLLMLITDGRPMDTDYDPESGYAQRDVRRACEENRRAGIQTFCISTLENSRTDMQTMFPGRRFVILDNLHELPELLPRLYLRMTS